MSDLPELNFKDLPRGRPRTTADESSAPRALWMDPDTLCAAPEWQHGQDRPFLGHTEDGTLIGIKDNRHLITVAGSRAGKGVSVILPNLLTYHGSMLVLDPKGENADITAERRGKGRGIKAGGLGQEVFVLDPFRTAKNVPDEYRAGFNPLADINPDDENFVDDCDSIADALVVAASGESDNHWNNSARLVLRGFVAWVASEPNGKKDLTEVRRLLHMRPDAFDDLLDEMQNQETRACGVPAEMAAALLGMGGDEMGSVLSTVRQNILFLSSPPMAAMLSDTTRQPDMRTWKMGGQTVYLCLPAGRLHRHSRFFRLYINRLMAAIESTRDEPKIPAVMLLDEMHVLGHMSAMETAAGLIAGYGVRIWSIWQDFNQLEAIYGKRWETFLGNASIFQSFGLNDVKSLKYVSERLGVSSVRSISRSEIALDAEASGFSGESKSIQQSPLLTADEVAYFFSRQTGNQLIIYPGTSPIFLKRLPYYHKYFADMRLSDGG